MLYSSMRFLFVLSLGAVLIVLACAGGDEEQGQAESVPTDTIGAASAESYDNWDSYTYRNIRVRYPPGHPREDDMQDVARNYLTLLGRNAQFFGIDTPKDTVTIYYYTGFGQGREMTGREYPFVSDSAIHFWQPSFYGPVMARWVLKKWSDVEPRHQFLKHGLIALLDFSGQNYHQSTMKYVDSGVFMPLAELAADTTIDVDKERVQSAEAASFVDFIAFATSPQELRVMYESPLPFDMLVQRMFNVSVDSLEKMWLTVAEQAATMTD